MILYSVKLIPPVKKERMAKIQKPAPALPKGPSQEELLTQIRDLLKK
jgi:large-conductance mechanosensitive channel